MVDMDPDHIFEVPDTPDRIKQSGGIARASENPTPSRKIRLKFTRNNPIQGQSSRVNGSSELPAYLDNDDIFRQAEFARVLPVLEDLEAKSSLPKSDRTTGKSVDDGKEVQNHGLDQSSSSSNHVICRGTRGKGHMLQFVPGESNQRGQSHRNIDFLGVGSDLPTIPVGKPRHGAETSTSNGPKEVASADVCSASSPKEDKTEPFNINGTAGLSSPTQCALPQRHVGRRKLVRNGCISPSNIAKRSVSTDKKQEMCSASGVLHHPNPPSGVYHKDVIDLTDSPTVQRQGHAVTDGLVSVNNMERRASHRLRIARAGETVIPHTANKANSNDCSGSSINKGKEIIHDLMGTKRAGEANTMRVCPGAAVESSSHANNGSTVMSSRQGWRTTHNDTSKLPMSYLGKTTSSSGIESGSSGPSNRNHEAEAGDYNSSISGAATILPPSSRNRTSRIIRGKRKQSSISYRCGESSSSLDEPRGSTAGRNHTTHSLDIPVIDIDDIYSPEVRFRSGLRGHCNGTSIDPNIRAQLDADELLARQLQEQLYNETPRVVPREEIDAIVAMSLQQEEDAQRTSRNARRFQNTTRGTRASRASHRALRVGYETASMTSHLRIAAPVTLGLRAFVARSPAPHLQPNIDLNDYDALLALDENNHQHTGASESQINNLLQSVVQSNNIEEPCAVCLETPSMGDTIRHLPCLHMFHKECIDEWLRRKKLCPVCKSGITGS